MSLRASERSFSALRRLKNWMRSSMTQQKLNGIVICHINKEILDRLDILTLAAERDNFFGSFST
jgi:hypothetical protein